MSILQDQCVRPWDNSFACGPYPTAEYRDVPGANTDTLYTTVWLDVSKEPWIFSIPDMGDRYYMMPMLDGWTNVFKSPGTRTTGNKAQKYAITGPGWSGTLPEDVTEYKSPTGLVWILGRIYCTGTPEDYAEVHAFRTSSRWFRSALTASSTPTTRRSGCQLRYEDSNSRASTGAERQRLFHLSGEALENKSASRAGCRHHRADGQHWIGARNRTSTRANSALSTKKRLKAVPKLGLMKMTRAGKEAAHQWLGLFRANVGNWGTDYLLRATTAWLGPGWNLPADAVYPVSQKDANGNDYNGAEHKYLLHFDKGQFPPVKGFWSLTMYDESNFLAANPLNRYTLSQQDKFATNQDGSVDLYLQADSPGKEKEANWLPAPKAKFGVMLRLYWPTDTSPSIIDGTWKPPAIKIVQ